MPTPEIAAPVAVVPYWTYLVPVGIALIAAIQTIFVAYFGSRVKTSVSNVADTVEKVHVAVNSERTALMDEIRQLHAAVANLMADNARLEQSATDDKAAHDQRQK